MAWLGGEEMKPVVISRPDRVGDVIVTSSCIPLVRELHPGAPVILIARSIMRSLFCGKGSIDQFIAYDGAQDRSTLKAQLQALEPAVIYHFHPDEVIQAVAAEAGIPERVGFIMAGQQVGLTFVEPYRKSAGQMHEAEYCRDLLVKFSGKNLAQVLGACLSPDPAAEIRLRAKAPWIDQDETRIAINPTAARIILRWPPESFEQLMRKLARPGRRIVLVGHPDDDPALTYLRGVYGDFPREYCDLAGQLDLAESAWLLKHSALHISRDTGTSHLAAAVGCPVLTIFGRLEPEFGPKRWRPLGEKAHLICAETTKRWWETKRQFWKRSFRSIEPERVIGQAEEILK